MGMVIDEKRVLKGPPRYRRLYSRLGYLPGDVIARCPIILLNRKETRLIKKTAWGPYLFQVGDGSSIFAVEYGSLCLSGNLPALQCNAHAIYDPDKWSGRGVLQVVCSLPIASGARILCSPLASVRPGSIKGRVFDVNNEVKRSPGKGLGVFARRNFNQNSLLERVPVLVAPSFHAPFINDTVMLDYLRGWNGGVSTMPLGFWAFHNTTETCDDTNSAERDYAKQRLVRIYCRKLIAKGEEITIPYIKESMTDTVLI